MCRWKYEHGEQPCFSHMYGYCSLIGFSSMFSSSNHSYINQSDTPPLPLLQARATAGVFTAPTFLLQVCVPLFLVKYVGFLWRRRLNSIYVLPCIDDISMVESFSKLLLQEMAETITTVSGVNLLNDLHLFNSLVNWLNRSLIILSIIIQLGQQHSCLL